MMRTRHTKVESGAALMFRAAQRARTRPPLMAWLLARFQVQQGWSEPQLAAHLGLPPDELPRLALCLRPRPDHFTDDVAALAAQVGCSPRALADLVRRTTADEHLKS